MAVPPIIIKPAPRGPAVHKSLSGGINLTVRTVRQVQSRHDNALGRVTFFICSGSKA